MGHEFCRRYLTEVMKDVRELLTKEQIKKAWAWKTSCGTHEFHGPDKFYWYGQAHCKYDAKAKGWEAWLRQEEEFNQLQKRGGE